MILHRLIITIGLGCLFTYPILSQERLSPLFSNAKLANYMATHKVSHAYNKQKRNSNSLPFFEDFTQQYILPDTNRWSDYHVYINSGLAKNLINYGVATFDGLNSTGYPYNFTSPDSYGSADSLTSKPINLSTQNKDSVYISFFYQPEGLGNKPEQEDSLVLEFYNSTLDSWHHVWSKAGSTSAFFKQAIIKVDSAFQTNNFQFRFRNYATLSGNVDHWHIDYIYLNGGRHAKDTNYIDVSYSSFYHNFLNQYTTMPWLHYSIDSTENMALSLPTSYKNLDKNTQYAVFFKYQVIDQDNQNILETYPVGQASRNISKNSTLLEQHAVYNLPINDFYFPPDTTVYQKVFQIKHTFKLNIPDSVIENDTLINYQVFGNEYGLDDGSAEAGYGVFGRNGKVAQKFHIKKKDTLTAIKINFNPIINNHENKTFKLMVWSSLNPEKIEYQETVSYNPQYLFHNNFYKYSITNPIVLEADTYYFGYSKVTQDFLNVGYDRNNDNSSQVFYSTGGTFFSSNFKGSLLLRPVFTSLPDPTVSIIKLKEKNVSIQLFPNPTSNKVSISVSDQLKDYNLDIYNLSGKRLMRLYSPKNVTLTSLPNGIYLFSFYDDNGHFLMAKKVIKTK